MAGRGNSCGRGNAGVRRGVLGPGIGGEPRAAGAPLGPGRNRIARPPEQCKADQAAHARTNPHNWSNRNCPAGHTTVGENQAAATIQIEPGRDLACVPGVTARAAGQIYRPPGELAGRDATVFGYSARGFTRPAGEAPGNTIHPDLRLQCRVGAWIESLGAHATERDRSVFASAHGREGNK
jgi:hypothetical protein